MPILCYACDIHTRTPYMTRPELKTKSDTKQLYKCVLMSELSKKTPENKVLTYLKTFLVFVYKLWCHLSVYLFACSRLSRHTGRHFFSHLKNIVNIV